MKKIIIGLVIVTATLGLMWLGQAAQPRVVDSSNNLASVSSPLAASETGYDFGTIKMSNGKVEKVFTLTNQGTTETEIKTIVTSCMCTPPFLSPPAGEKGPFGMPGHGGPSRPANEVIKAGESRAVRVVFDPNAHGPAGVGPIDRVITLTDAAGASLEFRIKGLVTP